LSIGAKGESWYGQLANLFSTLPGLLADLKPDLFINLGDMNPCLSGLIAKRLGIKYVRIECAMRSGTIASAYKNFDLPEEINRVAMDSIADLKLVYCHEYVPHLIREGHLPETIKVVGNTIIEVLDYYTKKWNIIPTTSDYDLVTFHRGNNMNPSNLSYFVTLLNHLYGAGKRAKFVCYGRTRKMLERLDLLKKIPESVEILDSQTQEDFLRLVAGCNIIVSDSGSTSSEESHYFHKPCLILRDSTERPSTLINNNEMDGNAFLWSQNLISDQAKYRILSIRPRMWNNRYYDAHNGLPVSVNIINAIKEFMGLDSLTQSQCVGRCTSCSCGK
jgi:UDP-N-acetylglucosamine 2-epimerase (non-hydrolysing)